MSGQSASERESVGVDVGETRAISAAQREPETDEMACPVCGSAMPDLKGGKATICPTCGFKDSCCF